MLQAENRQKGSQKDRKGDLHLLLNWTRISLNVISEVSDLGIVDGVFGCYDFVDG